MIADYISRRRVGRDISRVNFEPGMGSIGSLTCAGNSGTRDGNWWGCESVFDGGDVENFHEVGLRSIEVEDVKMRHV
jgi:hypothetical protein